MSQPSQPCRVKPGGGSHASDIIGLGWRRECYHELMVARTVEPSDELHRQISELARQTGRAETDLLNEAIATYVKVNRVPQPTSDGMIDDPELAARDLDDWLAANWRPG